MHSFLLFRKCLLSCKHLLPNANDFQYPNAVRYDELSAGRYPFQGCLYNKRFPDRLPDSAEAILQITSGQIVLKKLCNKFKTDSQYER